MIFYAALGAATLLFMSLYGWIVDRDVDKKYNTREARKKAKALEPRVKAREDFWAA